MIKAASILDALTLSGTLFTHSVICSSLFLVAAFFVSHYTTSIENRSEKKLSWIITGIASLVATIGSLPFLYQYLLSNSPLSSFESIHTATSVRLCAFFAAYLVSDLVIGSVFYRKQIHPLSGWFHHLLYMTVVGLMMHLKYTGIFCIFMVLELPTLILATGVIDPRLRNDLLFGAVFFSTRIIFHLFMICKIWQAFSSVVWLLPLAILPLHLMWFRGWIRQQTRRRRAKSEVVIGVERMVKCREADAMMRERSVKEALKHAINENERVIRVKTWVMRKVRQRFPRYMQDNAAFKHQASNTLVAAA